MININTTSIIVFPPFSEKTEFIDLSTVAINFNRKNHYINTLFYQKISISGTLILADQLNDNRHFLIRKLYNEVMNQLMFGALRESKISYDLSRFFQFIRWCDLNNIHNCLDKDENCVDAFNRYTNYCWEQVSLGKNKASTITGKLLILTNLLKSIIAEEFHKHLPNIKTSTRDRELTLPPDDDHASENLQILHAVINGINDFIITKKQYPYAWEVPTFLNTPKNTVWVFPIRSWCQTNLNENGTSKRKNVNPGFNYKHGRLVTQNELNEIGITDRHIQMVKIRRAASIIKKSNTNINIINSNQKKDFLRDAISCFAFLFIANTGMNPAQALNLMWTDEYDIQKDNIDFHSIKYRAFNKKVHFRIASKFLPTFKKYLKIRECYLLGKQSKYLIPSFGNKYDSHQDLVAISKNVTSLFKDLGYKKNLITARKWRCLKAEWLIDNVDPAITAKLLQNTESTILNHYSSGTFTKQTENLSDFLDKLSCVAMVTENPYKMSTSVGGCKEPDNPINISGEVFFTSDCKQPEGCLFCSNFMIHADESDLRKILSCKYCIENTQTLSRSYDDWHNIYDPVLLRIDEILNGIAEINLYLVDKMKQEVYIEGNLDSYWSGKLEMLINIGAIQNEN